MFGDFLNDVLKSDTHLSFYIHCQRIINQLINGDIERKTQFKKTLGSQHIRIERASEIIPKIFTPSTLLSIYEQQLKEKEKLKAVKVNKEDLRFQSKKNPLPIELVAAQNQPKEGLTNQ